MSDDYVPPARQCTMCSAEATATDSPPLCDAHAAAVGDETSEPPTEPDGAPDADTTEAEPASPQLRDDVDLGSNTVVDDASDERDGETDDCDTPGPSDISDTSDAVNPFYADVWRGALKRDDGEPPVTAAAVRAELRARGHADVWRGLQGHRDWVVWDRGDTTVVYYAPDLAGNTSTPRERLAARLEAVGAGTERFINVIDAQKGRFDTDRRRPDNAEISGNYGVVGGRAEDSGRWLVDIDVDDYDSDAGEIHPGVTELRETTLAVASAHTTVDRPGHLYVVVDGDAAAVASELTGTDNPTVSFGEIRVSNQYVVGPGSEILCDCDRCGAGDAPDNMGRYELANDTTPVVWSPDDFREFLLRDPEIDPGDDARERAAAVADPDRSVGPQAPRAVAGGDGEAFDETDDDDECASVSDVIDLAETADDYVADALAGASGSPDDRSDADSTLAHALAPWLGTRRRLETALDHHGTTKWRQRTDDAYRDYVVPDRRRARYDDEVPYWAVCAVAVADDVVDHLVARDSETGRVVDDPDSHDGDCYRALPRGTYNEALEHIRSEYGVDPGREPVGGAGPGDAPDAPAVVFDPSEAHRAARAVAPAQLDGSLGVATTADGEAWVDPHTGDRLGAVVAAAVDAGVAAHGGVDLSASEWTRAYEHLRVDYDAPLPQFLSRDARAERYDTVVGAVRALSISHLSVDAFASEVARSGDDCADGVSMRLDPAWRGSESGDSVVVYEGGAVYEPEPRVADTLDTLRVVALDAGVIDYDAYADSPDGTLLEGETFTEAYRVARERYGAPLPRLAWRDPDHTVVLPEAGVLVDDAYADPEQARRETWATVEELLGDAVTDSDASLVTALPGAGKSYASVKVSVGASDDSAGGTPVLYTAGRRELQQQAVENAREVGAEAYVLPVFAGEATPPASVIDAAVDAVREHPNGQRLLQRRWELRAEVESRVGDVPHPDDLADDSDAEAVDLDREVCATAAAEVDHNDVLDWWLAVHTARALGFKPARLHTHAHELFGDELPCEHDDCGCAYPDAWDRVADPDRPLDLLVGSPQHAHVASARTHYSRGPDNRTERRPRAVVVDEYPGDAWDREFSDGWTRHAAWLASAVDDAVNDTEDTLRRADHLWCESVRDWLRDDGEVGDPHAGLADDLGQLGDLVDARETAAWLRGTFDDAVLRDAEVFDAVVNLADGTDDLAAVRRALADADLRAVSPVVAENLADLRDTLDSVTATADAVETAVDAADTVAGPLANVITAAVNAVRAVDPTDDDAVDRAHDTVRAAQTACRGGRQAAELLAVYDDDGRAHPDAGALLWALLAPSDAEVASTHEWEHHQLAADDDPVRVSSVDMGRTTVLADRDHRAATVRRPPALDAGGGDCPLVGLDATGRTELWEHVVGTDMRRRDPHGDDADRRAWLRRQGLRVVQTTPEAKTYGGSVDADSMAGDAAVVEAAADEYAPAVGDDDPAVITTLKAERAAGDRLEAVGATSVDHYGDLKGSNRLGDHRLGVLLGCQHHGHAAVERAAAFAHQDATPTGRGIEQSYGSEVGDAYLQYMWHDTVMQAALRFGREPEINETVVVAHTAALRDDLPVVAEGDVVRAYSDGQQAVADAAADCRGAFTAADVRERLTGEQNPRSVRRQLAALVDAGYLTRDETRPGVANRYTGGRVTGDADADLPLTPTTVEAPDDSPQGISYTWVVRVGGGDHAGRRHRTPPRVVIPSPDTSAAAVEGDPPPS